MSPTRTLARSLLSAIYVTSGVNALRHPEHLSGMIESAGLSEGKKLAQVHGVTNLLGGLALATNRLPRLAALGLAVGMVPTTAVGHAFWSAEPEQKQMQQINFLKNLSMVGGLLMAVADTGGRESLPHAIGRVSSRSVKKADKAAGKAQQKAGKQAGRAAVKAGRTAGTVRSALPTG